MTNTLNLPLQKLFTVNSAASAFTTPSPTLTQPVAGSGYLSLIGDRWAEMPTRIGLIFFGTASDGQTMNFQGFAWRRGGTPNTSLWVPSPLFVGGTATLSDLAGVASSPVDASQRFADTLAVTTDYTKSTEQPGIHIGYTGGGDQVAWMSFDPMGADGIEIQVKKGTATGCNVLAWGY